MASAKELIRRLAKCILKRRAARHDAPETQGKCEGRNSYAERDPELVLACAPTTDGGLQQQAGHAVLGILRQVDAGGASPVSTGARR